MKNTLEIHAASADEMADAIRNFHDVWGGGFSVEEHVRRRLSGGKYKNAQWYVGCLDGRVVAGCGCYAFQLVIDGQAEPACAFGEVHTLPEFRGRGFAPQLIAFVEDEQRAAGKTISVLYSDISPSYYERLGYVLCACPQGWADPQPAELSTDVSDARLTRIDPAAELRNLAVMYERYHASFPLWIERSPWYWQYLSVRSPDDEFYYLESNRGARLGYLRAAVTPEEFKIRDLSFVSEGEESYRALYSAALSTARSRRAMRIGGWMPALDDHRDLFAISDRSRELTMVKPLAPQIEIGERHRAAGGFLHEIDHV